MSLYLGARGKCNLYVLMENFWESFGKFAVQFSCSGPILDLSALEIQFKTPEKVHVENRNVGCCSAQ